LSHDNLKLLRAPSQLEWPSLSESPCWQYKTRKYSMAG
jgi:hypothetical protein